MHANPLPPAVRPVRWAARRFLLYVRLQPQIFRPAGRASVVVFALSQPLAFRFFLSVDEKRVQKGKKKSLFFCTGHRASFLITFPFLGGQAKKILSFPVSFVIRGGPARATYISLFLVFPTLLTPPGMGLG